MKKRWEEPEVEVQEFMPNEYVAACWKINCNVPTGFGFLDNNKNGTYDRGDEKLTSDGVYGCGVWHTGVQGVFYWSDGYGQTHRHFSKVSDPQWETNPNAS